MKGKDVRKWREEMGWSQEQGAAATGKTRRQYQEMESTEGELDLTLEVWLDLFRTVRTHLSAGKQLPSELVGIGRRVNAIDAMPGPGRPKKDPYLAATEKLVDTVLREAEVLRYLVAATTNHAAHKAVANILNDCQDVLKARTDAARDGTAS